QGNFSERYRNDLLALLDYGESRRLDVESLDNEALRLYLKGVNAFYKNCFLDSVAHSQEFRTLTSHDILVQASMLMEMRALSRPFMPIMLDGFTFSREAALYVQDDCEGAIEAREFTDDLTKLSSQIQLIDVFEPFRDDFAFMKSVADEHVD
ncbi:MAG: hypothetical protein ACU0BK_03085, partial [Shimia sp.]